jgi:hypothetical protein
VFTESRDEMGDLDLPDADLLRAKLSEVGRVPYEYPSEYPGAKLSEVPRPAGPSRFAFAAAAASPWRAVLRLRT